MAVMACPSTGQAFHPNSRPHQPGHSRRVVPGPAGSGDHPSRRGEGSDLSADLHAACAADAGTCCPAGPCGCPRYWHGGRHGGTARQYCGRAGYAGDPRAIPHGGFAQGFRGKPHPDMFLAAAERMGIAPETCIVFEDAPLGVEAARRAGMRAVAVETMLTADAFGAFDNVVAALKDFTAALPLIETGA